MNDRPKPILRLIRPELEQILALFRDLTGREPTPEDIAICGARLNQLKKPPPHDEAGGEGGAK